MKYTLDKEKAVTQSWRIEKYDFIQEGIEGFNMNGDRDSLRVISCKNYQTRNKNNSKIHRIHQKALTNLASLYFDDFDGETREEFYAWRRSTQFRPIRWKDEQED